MASCSKHNKQEWLFKSGVYYSNNLFSILVNNRVPSVSLTSILLLLGAVVIFAVMVVAFELALAMKAHSVKEAGSLLGPAILFIIFPALFHK
ncbi:MAG: hypothetical protein CM15mP1_2810 [Methanobacteriota archaeon]|nr:MAG: hypothetical protein CM15mP1_2810 [Euryarchaeota archaeon]